VPEESPVTVIELPLVVTSVGVAKALEVERSNT
jgi:hypothetical protein